ncbi:MAG: hypothetical protein WBZ22_27640, partial [Pseudolabrys sp.]
MHRPAPDQLSPGGASQIAGKFRNRDGEVKREAEIALQFAARQDCRGEALARDASRIDRDDGCETRLVWSIWSLLQILLP